MTGGVTAAGRGRIRFDFTFEGHRYRPSLLRAPTEANLHRAREQLAGIKERIAAGAFSFADEFPDFRTRFLSVRYSILVKIADEVPWRKKTYNAISILRRAFKFGYRGHPERHDPTVGLKSARIPKKDRPVIDPFSIQDAETLIAAIHRDWGEAQGNYDESRFFAGLRPSEQVALLVSDFDSNQGTLTINKARVGGIDKDSTKTGDDRRIELCQRALQVLRERDPF